MVLAVEMMMMMIPMKSSSMTVMMAMFSSLPESFSLSVVFCPAEVAENSLDGSVGLRVSGGRSTPKGAAKSGPGAPHPIQARSGVGPRLD